MAKMVVDGGYAWMVCAGCFFTQVVQGGIVYSMGVIYVMLQDGLQASDSALALVTSLHYSLLFMIGPVAGILVTRFGERLVGILGALLASMGLALSSLVNQVGYMYLTYSVAAGVGMGLIFNPSYSILSKYFYLKRKTATGLATCGNGIGGFLMPPIIKALEDSFGWRGALLIVAAISANNIVFCALYRPQGVISQEQEQEIEKAARSKVKDSWQGKQREDESISGGLELQQEKKKDKELDCSGKFIRQEEEDQEDNMEQSPEDTNGFLRRQYGVKGSDPSSMIPLQTGHHSNYRGEVIEKAKSGSSDSSSFRNGRRCFPAFSRACVTLFSSWPFICICLHSLLVMFPTMVLYTHLGRYMITLGYNSSDGVRLYMAMGVTTMLARVLTGVITDCSSLNTAVLVAASSGLLGVITMLLPLSHALVLLFVYAVVASVLLSPYNALAMPITAAAVPATLVGTAYGVVCLTCVPGCAFGAPLAAWLYTMTSNYAISFYFTGVLLILSCFVLLPPVFCCKKQVKSAGLQSKEEVLEKNSAV